MARQSYGRRANIRRWIFGVLVVVIIGAIVFLIFATGPEQENQSVSAEQVQPVNDVNAAEISGEIEFKEFVPKSPDGTVINTENALPETPDKTAADSNMQTRASQLIEQAMDNLKQERPDIIKARNMLNESLLIPLPSEKREQVKQKLAELSEKWLFSRTVYPGDNLCETYTVRPGDSLVQIAKEHKVPHQILMKINGIANPRGLRAGEPIKVIKGPFHARISLGGYKLDLYLQKTYIQTFSVGIGKPGHDTPTGLWIVEPGGKLIKPTWTDPDTGKTYTSDDPDYPLGSRWIGLKGVSGNAQNRTGFAIHGTKDPNEIGAAVSRGCIRMYNGDAILMYNVLEPGHSQVKIVK